MHILTINWRWLRFFLPGIGVFWIILTGLFGTATTDGKPPIARDGFPAPEIKLPNAAGEIVSLAELRGKVVLINFWASWCPPCKAEMPALQTVYEDYQSDGLVVLGVNAAYQDDTQAAAQFITQTGLTFPIVFDNSGDSARQYLVNALPSTFFIDREGVIQKVIYGGPLSESLLRIELSRLLEAQN